MTPRFRRVAVFVGTAALAAGTGIGVAASSGDSQTTAPSNRSAPGTTGQRQGPPGMDISALADELGVSETRLEKAMRSARPTDPAAGGGPDAMIQALADELGLSAGKVRQAFADAFGNRGPGGAPPASGGQTTPPSDGQSTTPDDAQTSQS